MAMNPPAHPPAVNGTPGRCWNRLSLVLTSAVSWARLRLAMLAGDRFIYDQTSSGA
jgi:hypothetical protein